jgi:ribonuclease P protein component
LVPSNPKRAKKKVYGITRSHRITKRGDFARLRKNSRKWVSRHWILYYAANDLGSPRLAFSVSTKYGNAVSRNRYRRQIREAFRLRQVDLPAVDLHFIARQKPANLAEKRYIEELHEDFEKLVHRLR